MSELLERDKKYVWHPFTQMKTAGDALPIVRAEGSYLYDENGKSYIDCNSSWWVNVHGHGHPHIQQALAEQFKTLDHTLLAGVTHPKAVELAERIVGILPEKFTKVFFSDNGSTAIEVALKMVFQFWYNKGIDKKRVLALDGAYHGDTFGAMSVGQRSYFNAPFEHFFFDVDYLDFPFKNKEEEVLKQAEEFLKTGEFAGIIVEPLVQGSGGMRMYSPEFLNKLTLLAQEHDALVIFDEVMTGWGRTGKMFSMDHIEAKPDIVCLSKGLTAGALAMGLTVATERLYEGFLDDEKVKALLHGHSYTGNPVTCAVACANLDLFAKPELKENLDRITASHEAFKAANDKHDKVSEIRITGTIMALEIETGEGNTYFSNIRDEAYNFFLENGMLLRPLGNIMFLNPPYCTTNEELQYCYDKIMEFVERV